MSLAMHPRLHAAGMDHFIIETYFVWLGLAAVSLFAPRPSRVLLVLGFVALSAPGVYLLWIVEPEHAFLTREMRVTLQFLCFGALALVALGVLKLLGGHTEQLEAPGLRDAEADQLIASCAATGTVNDIVEDARRSWLSVLKDASRDDEQRCYASDAGKYTSEARIEKYARMERFGELACGQLRTVRVSIAGPETNLPWLSTTIQYAIENRVVAVFAIDSRTSIREGVTGPRGREEVRRIARFLESGRVTGRWLEAWRRVRGSAVAGLSAPAHLGLLAVGVPAAIARWGWRALQRTPSARTTPAKRPTALPIERAGAPIDYWCVTLAGLADRAADLRTELASDLEARTDDVLKTRERELTQWGGHAIKETRRQVLMELRRARVLVSVWEYGDDLHVRWESQINRSMWMLRRFSFAKARHALIGSGAFGWCRPLFQRVPSLYDYAPALSPATDYDWADADALAGIAHRVVTARVKEFKTAHEIEQEIDYEMQRGTRPAAGPDKESGKRGGLLGRWRGAAGAAAERRE